MIQNFLTRCAFNDAPLHRLIDKVQADNEKVVFTCGVRRCRGKSFLGREAEIVKKKRK